MHILHMRTAAAALTEPRPKISINANLEESNQQAQADYTFFLTNLPRKVTGFGRAA